jgi:hypothetical protein
MSCIRSSSAQTFAELQVARMAAAYAVGDAELADRIRRHMVAEGAADAAEAANIRALSRPASLTCCHCAEQPTWTPAE